ncbi:MAG TPA: methylmalonyl-CoA epimerase [Candidatus Polarisedimenticolaceae bacterium]|nr:methylmalonyl-CoA epimerase [Candidatus Polarisedimenticolaceae bacterium]
MIHRIDHLGLAVRRLEERLPFWSEILGLEVTGMETVDVEGVRVAFLPVGEARLELLEPTRPDSVVARFLAKHGEGLHHVTLEVAQLEEVLGRLRQHGVQLVGAAPRPGAGGRSVAFLHPGATGGVLVELVQSSAERGAGGSASLQPGSVVVAYLREPPEKLWGVLRRLDSVGLVVEGINLNSFDEWTAQIGRGDEEAVGASVLFLPMARVDKLLLDRSAGGLPSLAERFRQRTGRGVRDVLG